MKVWIIDWYKWIIWLILRQEVQDFKSFICHKHSYTMYNKRLNAFFLVGCIWIKNTFVVQICMKYCTICLSQCGITKQLTSVLLEQDYTHGHLRVAPGSIACLYWQCLFTQSNHSQRQKYELCLLCMCGQMRPKGPTNTAKTGRVEEPCSERQGLTCPNLQ